MERIIKSMEDKYLLPALDMVEKVFTDSESPEEGALVRSLVEEIRGKRWYLPQLELIMVDDQDEVIGYGRVKYLLKHTIEFTASPLFVPVGVNDQLQVSLVNLIDRLIVKCSKPVQTKPIVVIGVLNS